MIKLDSIQIRQVRDLTIWEFTQDEWLVFAIDSLGGIGERAHDAYLAKPEDVGYFTARVGLFELLCAGAIPTLLVDTLSVGGEYAARIIRGIKEAVNEAELPESFPITGSSEDNVVTQFTALGITLVGKVQKAQFRPGHAKRNDEVWLVGSPKAAPHDDVFRGDKSAVSFAQLRELSSSKIVHDLLPIGSKGCLYEANQMASSAGLVFMPNPKIDVGLLLKSGGPATSLIVAGKLADSDYLHNLVRQLPCTYLGTLEDKS